MYDPTEPGHIPVYNLHNIPAPPPPPKLQGNKRSHRVFITVVIALLLAISGIVMGIVYAEQHSNTTVSARSQAPITTPTQLTSPTSQIQPTPNQDIQVGLTSSDFNMFLKAFAIAMASKQYDVIQNVTDTTNYRAIPLCASGGTSWSDTYDELRTGNLSAVLQYPQITPYQEGYTGYTDHSATGIGNINATAVRYDVGTLSGNGVTGTTQTNRDGTVFIFESLTGSSWLWRGYVTNNDLWNNGNC